MTWSGWRIATGAPDDAGARVAIDEPSERTLRTAWLGLGTNVGDRGRHLDAALRGIARVARIDAVSPVYASAPIGYADQPEFWNLVTRVRTPLEPVALLRALKALEAELGRTPTFRNGPREIDVDVLLYDDVVRDEAPIVPHPRMHERAFVLQPLLDLDPELRDPRDGSRWVDRLEQVADQRLARVSRVAPLLEGDRNED